jgi:antitoxin CptB
MQDDQGVEQGEEHRRMRWASRRGMLELDLILEPFVDQHYAGLGAVDRARYRQLMGCQDQELFAWFLKRETPEDSELASIVALVLAHARGEF